MHKKKRQGLRGTVDSRGAHVGKPAENWDHEPAGACAGVSPRPANEPTKGEGTMTEAALASPLRNSHAAARVFLGDRDL
jgi:hypothetical protein